jgi:hypothetical protein
LASTEENDDDAHSHYEFAIAAARSLKSINKDMREEDHCKLQTPVILPYTQV